MRHRLTQLKRLNAVVERAAKMATQLLGVTAGDEGGDDHQAPVPGREPWPAPDISEQDIVSVSGQGGRDGVHVRRRDGAWPAGRLSLRSSGGQDREK